MSLTEPPQGVGSVLVDVSGLTLAQVGALGDDVIGVALRRILGDDEAEAEACDRVSAFTNRI